MLRVDSPIPRYVQLSDLFRQRIVRGTWRQGQRIPSLEALIAEFGVSRETVRQAIDVLAREGLVSPEQGRGTFVRAVPATDRWLKVQTSLDSLAEVYRDTRPEIITFETATATPQLAPDEGAPAAEYVYMRRLHSHDGRPYCLISIYLARDVFELAPERFRTETVITVLQSFPAVRIARARQTLTIATADVETAARLRVPVNSPVAEVRRCFGDPEARVIYLGLVTYRGDFVRLEMDLSP